MTMMERVAPGYREAIGRALDLVPDPIRQRLRMEFVTGIDPGYIGLHRYGVAVAGWTYSQVAHAGRSHGGQPPYIVLPLPLREMEQLYWTDGPGLPQTILHEMGHILDYDLRWRPAVRAVSTYGETNQREAFAEAFSGWVLGDEAVLARAPEAAAFLDALAGWS